LVSTKWGEFRLGEKLLASQEGQSCMEIVVVVLIVIIVVVRKGIQTKG